MPLNCLNYCHDILAIMLTVAVRRGVPREDEKLGVPVDNVSSCFHFADASQVVVPGVNLCVYFCTPLLKTSFGSPLAIVTWS